MADHDLSVGSPNDTDHRMEIAMNDLVKRLEHAAAGGHYPRRLAKEAAEFIALLWNEQHKK